MLLKQLPKKSFSEINILDIGNNIQITGAVWEGNGKAYLCQFPNDSNPDSELEILDISQSDWEKFIRQTDILETEILAQTSGGKLVKSIIRKSTRQIEQGISWRVFHRDGYKCRYCGAGNGIPLTVDHLVLWEKQGPTIEANLVSACRKCNKTRGNIDYKDWLQHPYYIKVSANLQRPELLANYELLNTLDSIPLRKHERSR
jgi:hypothetical protein